MTGVTLHSHVPFRQTDEAQKAGWGEGKGDTKSMSLTVIQKSISLKYEPASEPLHASGVLTRRKQHSSGFLMSRIRPVS